VFHKWVHGVNFRIRKEKILKADKNIKKQITTILSNLWRKLSNIVQKNIEEGDVKTQAKSSTILKQDLISGMNCEQVFQKHIIDGSSYYFTEVLKKPNLEYELRHELAKALKINVNDVIIVGSSKLGYSVKTDSFKSFDAEFTETGEWRKRSDIDIAIINRNFYDKTIEQIYHLSRHFDEEWIKENWRMNWFFKEPRKNLHIKYALYLAKGWIRPDYLPGVFLENAEWTPVCNVWHKKLNKRKICVGFYADWIYLKHYQMDNLEKLRGSFGKQVGE